MNPIYAEIRNIYDEYLDYLQDNPRIRLPDHQHDPELSIGKVHASALGRCPLASAKSRGVKGYRDLATKHLMEQGKRDAEPIQEAVYWKGNSVEVSVEREHLRGRLDILMHNKFVVELKRRDSSTPYKKVAPAPKLTDAYQLLAYSWMTRLSEIHLCTFTRFELYFWQLVPKDTGFVLIDENGDEWKSSVNNPSYLNYGSILADSREHLAYLTGEKTVDPMPNFLNMISGSECFHWENAERPKKFKESINGEQERTANIVPHCHFWCHHPKRDSVVLPVREVEYGTKKYELYDSIIEKA